MNPSNDNGLNFFETDPLDDDGIRRRQQQQQPPQHHCRHVDMNNNCACVTNGANDAEDINDEGDKLVCHQQVERPPQAPIDPSPQLPALRSIRLTNRRPRRSVRKERRVVTIDKLISRISALSKVATGTGSCATTAVRPHNELISSRVRLTVASKVVQDRRILRI